MRSKRAAMEMSVGTIVTIVLLMSVLVLGIFLIRNIFQSSKGAIDLTDQQLQAEIEKLFSDDSTKITLYPTSAKIKIKVGDTDAIGLGIKNIATSFNEGEVFSYEASVLDNTCGLTDTQANALISLGKEREDIQIPISGSRSMKITFQIPEGVPNCLISYTVEVKRGSLSTGTAYDGGDFIVEIKA